jgi:hypothetical protein
VLPCRPCFPLDLPARCPAPVRLQAPVRLPAPARIPTPQCLSTLQGKYASLGLLKRGRDWAGSGVALALALSVLAAYYLTTAVSNTRAESIRKAATRTLGIDD